MLRHFYLAALPLIAACGDSKSKDDAPAVVVYGNVTIADSKSDSVDNGSYALTTADTCSRDIPTGLVKINLSQGAGKASLGILIRDYSPTAKTYTCTQAPDNVSDASVGSLYSSCAVSAKVPMAAGSAKLDGYEMFRESTSTTGFTYAGTCTVAVTTDVPTAKGTVSCTGMIQTMVNSLPRNPIVPTITATATGDFNCNFR